MTYDYSHIIKSLQAAQKKATQTAKDVAAQDFWEKNMKRIQFFGGIILLFIGRWLILRGSVVFGIGLVCLGGMGIFPALKAIYPIIQVKYFFTIGFLASSLMGLLFEIFWGKSYYKD